ncbi:hypothetical protein [Photobacterium damselae]|uniref:Class I SAM-dependent methyltransferase n=1 Tax=Photobacterium damselae TaxID=38293 RepID=A0ABD6WYI9_PHODM|nr:hypothetical protein [Photobacterium damselae]OBU42447.1 hypothetical protein AYY27_19430 [Photobacterium damselae]PSU14139.1 hypothetical protein CTM90_19825 [Photobacterium damselae]
MKDELRELYNSVQEKASDKWSLYIDIYSKEFKSYKDKNISLCEIGIQNGGSLDIWSKYFNNIHKILGCDINPLCGDLKFDNKNIKVIVNDANKNSTKKEIEDFFDKGIDIFIDDGSHISSDIIKSFLLYFEMINEGGLYIAEDLHCSYWKEFEGGISDPDSSINFFKTLADIINHEHWGIAKSKNELLNHYTERYSIHIKDEILEKIHSIKFYNSVCIIEKKKTEKNILGPRIICQGKELAASLSKVNMTSIPYDQNDNFWSSFSEPLGVEYINKTEQLVRNEKLLDETRKEILLLKSKNEILEKEISIIKNTGLFKLKILIDNFWKKNEK